jgi:hypothetical protein
MNSLDQLKSGEYGRLFEAPKPRKVRVKTTPLIVVVVPPAAALILIYYGIQAQQSFHHREGSLSSFDNSIFDFIFPAILVVVSSVMSWIVRRHRELLRTGELAVGVVTHQKMVRTGGRGGNKVKSKIRYCFKSVSGELFQGTGTDDSRRLLVGMTVPVFYNLKDPGTNVTLCTALCELSSN